MNGWHASVDAAQTLLSLSRTKDLKPGEIAGYLYEAVVAITRAINEVETKPHDDREGI